MRTYSAAGNAAGSAGDRGDKILSILAGSWRHNVLSKSEIPVDYRETRCSFMGQTLGRLLLPMPTDVPASQNPVIALERAKVQRVVLFMSASAEPLAKTLAGQ
jgi:hypothetical protein